MFDPFTTDIDKHVQEALTNYFLHRLDPGSFTTSCLCNDLVGASLRAHPINLQSIGYIGKWLMHNAPAGSWGNADLVKDWMNGGEYYQRFEKSRMWDILKSEYENFKKYEF